MATESGKELGKTLSEPASLIPENEEKEKKEEIQRAFKQSPSTDSLMLRRRGPMLMDNGGQDQLNHCPSMIDMMSSVLTQVIMHTERGLLEMVQLSAEQASNIKRTSKRSQSFVSQTLSIDLGLPALTGTEVDGKAKKQALDSNAEDIMEAQEEEEPPPPLTLAAAIARKYLGALMLSPFDDTIDDSLLCTTPPKSPILPSTVVLNDCDIMVVGDLDQIQHMCQYVRELDLAQNNITDLCEVEKILNAMTHLTFLNLSSNDLSSNQMFPMETSLTSMRWLVLNSTRIPWNTLDIMLHHMPNLEELYLSLNGYTNVQLDEAAVIPSVHLVHISGNPISEWKDIQTLGKKFPNLQTLVMADCQIVHLDNPEEIGDTFPHLQSLNISNNLIPSWDQIDKFLLFPLLIDLRLLGIPLLENYNEQERRQLMVARLPKIERLNGSRINDDERENAERAFIRYYMKQNSEERPGRYEELVAKHGRLQPLAEVDLRPKITVQVLLVHGQDTQVRTVNVRQTVGSFKASLQDFVGFGVAQMRIFYVDKELKEVCGPEELRNNSKMLYAFNLQDGDEFHIDRKY